MRISDWSSTCALPIYLLPQGAALSSEDLYSDRFILAAAEENRAVHDSLTYEDFCQLSYIELRLSGNFKSVPEVILERQSRRPHIHAWMPTPQTLLSAVSVSDAVAIVRSEEHTSELQSLMRISYADFCLKKNKIKQHIITTQNSTNKKTKKISTKPHLKTHRHTN